MPDFTLIDNHADALILTPTSDQAKAWAKEHLADDAMRWVDNGVLIDRSYKGAILACISLDGLTTEEKWK